MANKVTSSAANGNYDERTDVFYGAENVLKTELQIFSNATEKIDSCMNFTRPQLAVELELIKKAFIDAKSRGQNQVPYRNYSCERLFLQRTHVDS